MIALTRRRLLTMAGLVAAFALMSYGALQLAPGTPKESGASGVAVQPSPSELDQAYADTMAQVREDNAGPAFAGRLGSFDVVEDDPLADVAALCPDGGPLSRGADFLASELNFSEGMTSQLVCPSGEVVMASAFATGVRLHFDGPARAWGRGASQDRLQLTAVDGHEALVVIPPAGLGAHFIYVIDRLSKGDTPGIMFGGLGMTYERAIDVARSGLAVTPGTGSGTPNAATTPGDLLTYTNSEHGYAIDYPAAWELLPSPTFCDSEDTDFCVQGVTLTSPEMAEVNVFVNFQGDWCVGPADETYSKQDISVSGRPGIEYRCPGYLSDTSTEAFAVYRWFPDVVDGVNYLVSGEAADSLSTVLPVVESFRFIGK